MDGEPVLKKKKSNVTRYLGRKGYTIDKSSLTLVEQEIVKQELIARPLTQQTRFGGGGANEKIFPVYRESPSKLYVPRFYGEMKWGVPQEIRLFPGENIHIPFEGTLYPRQQDVVDIFMNAIRSGKGGGLISLDCGEGKTVVALKILAETGKKGMVVVHQDFLADQWRERMTQFLPTAKIGRIQGQIIDIEGKDIVIATIQSLSMKEYPESLFESFGITIFDEVHHMGSEVFSRALFKVVTPYTLGLSATMNRKDGNTKIFKMFLGDILVQGKKEHYAVEVRLIDYKVSDPDFNAVATDYRGNVMYSTMISKLCSYNPRTEFILKVITDLFIESSEDQLIILAHNRNILEYLFNAITHRGIANGSVGYYVGGMKDKDRKESENKKIVLATYSLASEGLDIKTLSRAMFITPKTDVEQSTGRILRLKKGKKVIVDIVDSHEPFRNQSVKRCAFFKKHHYTLLRISSTAYTPDITKWKTIYYKSQKKSISCLTQIREEEEEEEVDEEDDKSIDEDKPVPSKELELLQGKCLLSFKQTPIVK